MRSHITTHVLDTTAGKPAAGIPVVLERRTDGAGWEMIGQGMTDTDGRLSDLIPPSEGFRPGDYRLVFEIGPYFLLQNSECFFPQVTITFLVKDPGEHFHVPLLVSPFGYSTYRGS